MTKRTAGIEAELKLTGTPATIAALRSVPLLRGLGKPRRLIAHYFDTADDRLRAAGVTLRVRREGRGWVQTVKVGASAAGLCQREETEQKVAGGALDIDALIFTPVAQLLSEEEMAGLVRRFSVEVERLTREVVVGGSRIEVALDSAAIARGRRLARFVEVELELREGRVADLYALARQLDAATPLMLGYQSKADRGFALGAAKAPTSAVKAAPVMLHAAAPVAAAFQQVARACLRQFIANAERFGAAESPETVHQMRVAMRRLRAALSIFRGFVADAAYPLLIDELRWITGVLGTARDLDVRIARTDAANTAAQALAEQRKAAYRAARTALASPRGRALLIDLSAWIEDGAWRLAGGASAETVGDMAARSLEALARKVRKQGRWLLLLDVEERHELRKRIKKLRYAGEFFSTLFVAPRQAKAARAYLALLAELQDALGALNDIAVIRAAEGGGRGRAGVKREELQQLKAAEGAFRKLARAEPFWPRPEQPLDAAA